MNESIRKIANMFIIKYGARQVLPLDFVITTAKGIYIVPVILHLN